MDNIADYNGVIEEVVLVDGTIYKNVATSSNKLEDFLGIIVNNKTLYLSKNVIKTIRFTGERW